MGKFRHFLPWLVVFCLALVPISITGANGTVTVSIVAPAEVNPGSSFVADVAVDWVTDFNSCGFDVTYDETIITVTDVTGGEIDGHTVEVDPGDWFYIPSGPDQGRIRVITGIAGIPGPGVTGTGYIAQIHFNVVGYGCQTSAIHLEGVGMYDYEANRIDTTTVDDSVHVADVLGITTTSLPEAKVGDVYSATLTATGGQPPYTWGATGLPAGLTCSTAGVISGTPTASGDFTVTVTVTDSAGPPDTDSKGLALKVYPALEITTTALPSGTPGEPYSATLAATGGKPPLTWGATGLPAGLSCSTAGVISGTTTATGDFSVTVTVTDSFSTPNTDEEVLSLRISYFEISTTSLPEAKVGDSYTVTLEASGGTPPYTWGATGLPAGLTCSTAGVISGTPTASGDFTVAVTVTDSATPPDSESKDLALKVYPALEIITTSLPEAKVGDVYSATLTATGGKPGYTWGATGLPAGLTCSTAGVISGTPTASGDFSVTVTVTDSFSTPNTDSKILALKVYPPLEITTTSLPDAKVGDAYSATLTATGGKTPRTWVATGLPAGLTCSTAGVISGTPTAFGDLSVTVTVTDSFSTPNTDSKILALKVYAALEITTTSPLPEAKVGDPYSATLTATGGKTPHTWGATGLPAGLTCSTAVVISGTPTASGDFSVTVTATDSFSPPNIVNKVLSLKVYAALEITTTSLPNIKIGYAYSTTLVATGGKTPHTWGATGLPAGLTCSTAGVISGNSTVSGNFSVTVTVTDSFTTPNIDQKILALWVCIVGDANGDGVVDTGDITKVKRIYFGIDPPTDCADVNDDGKVDTGDITAIRIIYFG
ncbi:MAG: putative Ig domain-containing protein [Dehalococcoidia bacterium]